MVIGTEADGKPGRDNVFTLTHLDDGRWRVAYFERGSFDDARYFASEADACRDFVGMLPGVDNPSEGRRAWDHGSS
ncbi:hypothetical protein [Knoellia koreensis]|uniref:Uncharacterized protein n=1 Tax=Knoellia koreensis TaxID=2730921 RepID=A0A849HI73_9MICO|nr:hypothetical protein [Knoellia sp. DB2414S]NNM44407.1 hypothetical protein [Knoellia sp. DB2414S]